MRQFFNQFKKDFNQIFFSPVFFLMAGLCSSIWSFVFPRQIFEFARKVGVSSFTQGGMEGGANIYGTVFISQLSLTHLLLLFTIPIFTMRLIAEEKKLRTFDLLLTAPITSTKIVLGKFLAAYAVVLILVTVSFLYPISTMWFTEFNIGLLISAYVSIALLMGIYTAIGLFSSSLSASIMLSVFLGIMFSVSLHFISLGGQFSNNSIYSSIAEYLSISTHLDGFFRGNVASSSVLFFFIIAGFFLFMTQRIIESSRWRAK